MDIVETYLDFFQGVYASRRGVRSSFGIRVEEDHFSAIVRIGSGQPFTFGKQYPLPTEIDTQPWNLRMTVDDHMMNYPASDLLALLTGRKSFQEALPGPTKIEPQRAAAIGGARIREVVA